MKLLGFIKEYNELRESIDLEDLLLSKSSEINDTEKILHYLNQGVLLLGWMGYFIDVRTKELIAPDSYFTDGIWVWPSYFPYYLKRFPSIKVDKEFVNYLKARNYHFKLENDFESYKNEFERELSYRLGDTMR